MKLTNRLSRETSPYLLQHQDNPVDWHPWSDAAFSLAREEDKPVFLSVGYSACHWCHVMERESFENEAIAALMNGLFVNIKVDREERPDVDSIYMSAVQSMTGRGGWPMSVFLTPDGVPFYGGTYFPSDDRGGMPSFPRVLQSVSDAYHHRRADIAQNGKRVVDAIESQTRPRLSVEPIAASLFQSAYRHLKLEFDWQRGGLGLQPKFPQPMLYEFLLSHAALQGNEDASRFTSLTLKRMARGGIYDQIGGGFHRYSVDSVWLVPHFEKMLYDNAQLATLYLHAWQLDGDEFHRTICEDTLRYLAREMRDPSSGAFYSATDADSEGEEGRYFIWHQSELEEILTPELARVASAYWGVTRDGNFEGMNILHVSRGDDSLASDLGISTDELRKKIYTARQLLYAQRLKRVPPLTDDKIITSWNALAMKAFAEAGAALERYDWVDIAVSNAKFMLRRLVRIDDGRLMRTCKADSTRAAALPGYLEDYAYLADALMHLYEATFEMPWLEEARRMCHEMVRLFWDEDSAVFYDTGADQSSLVVRPRDIFDNAQPSGGSAAALALLRCAEFTDDQDLHRYGAAGLRSVRELMERAPSAFAGWLLAAQQYANPTQQIVIVGKRNDETTRAMLSAARLEYGANRVLAFMDPDDHPHSIKRSMPLFEGRKMVDGNTTAYVCQNYVCDLPVTSAAELIARL